MTTFVLVPGFWLGAWAWRPITAALRADGHEVYPLSLTGTADRVHLARPDIDLETHVTDLLNLLRYEELNEVVLVGHSYGGCVTTVAADRAPERIARLVYVDSGPLPDGFAQADFSGPEERAANEARAAAGEWLLPPPPWTDLAAGRSDVDAATLATLAERAVPQPLATSLAPLRLTGTWAKLPRFGILSSFTAEQARSMAADVPAMRHMGDPGWVYAELPTWHWPMFSRPAELTDLLRQAAQPA